MALKFNPLVFGGFDMTGSGGGGEGPPGPKGAWTPKGEWKAATAYAVNDAVTWKGATYGCIKAMTAGEDKEPPNATFWEVLAEKGAAGAEGAAGQGVPVGGTTGQVLTKKSNTNFDDEWKTPAGGAPSGAAGGDLAGEYPNPTIGGEKVVASKIATNAVETAKVKDKAITDAKLVGLEWLNVEAVNAKLEQTVTIQVAVFNGLVFMRGKGKTTAEIAAKGILFTIPAAARPATERSINCNTTTNAGQTINVKTNGEVESTVLLATGKTPFFDGLFYSL